MIQVAELKGYNSLRAFNAYHTLMLGLKMLPSYMALSYEEFYAKLDQLPFEDQKKMIKEAALFVKLEQEELEAIVSFCSDANGVPYTKENMKHLGPDKLVELIVAVCCEIAKIGKRVDFVSEAEKKK